MLAQHGDGEEAMKTLNVEVAMEEDESRRPSTQGMLDAPNADGCTPDKEADSRSCEKRPRSDSAMGAETTQAVNEPLPAMPADSNASDNAHKTKTRAKYLKISLEVTTVLDIAEILLERKQNRHAVKMCAMDLKIHRTSKSAPAYVTQNKFKDGIKMQRVTAIRAFNPGVEINIDCIRSTLEAAMPLGSKFARQLEVRAAVEDAYHTVIRETLSDCTPIDLKCQSRYEPPPTAPLNVPPFRRTDPLVPAAGCLKGAPRPEFEQHRAARALKEARHAIREELMTKILTGTSKRSPKSVRRQIQQLGSPHYNGSQSQSPSQVPNTEQT